jgi:predicted metal-binding protein
MKGENHLNYDIHCFVCTKCSPGGKDNCPPKDCGQQLRDDLKQMAKSHSFKHTVRVNAAGCLGHCEKGLNAVIYPQAEWHSELKATDAGFLFQRLCQLDQD